MREDEGIYIGKRMAVQMDIGYHRDINHICEYINIFFLTAKDGHYKYGKEEN